MPAPTETETGPLGPRQQMPHSHHGKPPAEPPFELPRPEPALAHRIARPEYIQRPRRSSIHFTASARQPRAAGIPRARVLVDDHERSPRPEHTANFAANTIDRLAAPGARKPRPPPPRRSSPGQTAAAAPSRAPAIKPGRLGEHRRREVEPDDLCAPLAQAPAQTGPCRSPDRARGGRQAAARLLDDRQQPRIVRRNSRLNRPRSASNRAATTASCSAIMRPSPRAISSRCFHARTATETPERAQNMKPSTPSRNPCLNTIELEKRPERPQRQVAGPEPARAPTSSPGFQRRVMVELVQKDLHIRQRMMPECVLEACRGPSSSTVS